MVETDSEGGSGGSPLELWTIDQRWSLQVYKLIQTSTRELRMIVIRYCFEIIIYVLAFWILASLVNLCWTFQTLFWPKIVRGVLFGNPRCLTRHLGQLSKRDVTRSRRYLAGAIKVWLVNLEKIWRFWLMEKWWIHLLRSREDFGNW